MAAQHVDTPEAANRLARAIASDVSMYNEAKIKTGIEQDTFFEIIAEEIAEGLAHYNSRVVPELQTVGIFERALCDVIVARKGHIKSNIW